MKSYSTAIDGKLYEIVAIMGYAHDDCKKHFDNSCKIKITHPVCIISIDVQNDPIAKMVSKKITKKDIPGEVKEPKFADKEYLIDQKSYRELLDIYQNSNNRQELIQELKGLVRDVT